MCVVCGALEAEGKEKQNVLIVEAGWCIYGISILCMITKMSAVKRFLKVIKCYKWVLEKEGDQHRQSSNMSLFSTLHKCVALPLWPGISVGEMLTVCISTLQRAGSKMQPGNPACLVNIYVETIILTAPCQWYTALPQGSFNLEFRLLVIKLSFLSTKSSSESQR